MTDRRDDLLDEAVLRRSLRLDADERPPRFDAAAIAARAAERRPFSSAAHLVGAGVLIASGLSAPAVWEAVASFAWPLIATAFDAALSFVAVAAMVLTAVVEMAQQPVIPASLLVGLAIAIVFELRQRKETEHVIAS